MIVYLDTEFTGFKNPQLISAGFVCGDREFYFEVHGIAPDMCSSFVVKNVLPLLSGDGLVSSEIIAKLGIFLGSCGDGLIFLCDAPRYDIALIKPYLPGALRWYYSVPSFPTKEQFELFSDEFQAELDTLRQHHALDDARALAKIWKKFHPSL